MVHFRTMHHSHPFSVQTAALFVALLPFVLLFTLMIVARLRAS